MSGAASPLRLLVGGELGCRFESLPPAVERRLRAFFAGLVYNSRSDARDELVVAGDAPPPDDGAGRVVLISEAPVQVWRAGSLVGFEVPGATGWCDPEQGRGGLRVRSSDPHLLEVVAGLIAAPLLMELAVGRGWLGLHAAGVAWEGRGVLLPAPSGSGKSTIFRNAAARGLDVLSDDLIWVHETRGGFRMWPFPRGAPAEAAPNPTAEDVSVEAIVCPTITESEHNRLLRITPQQTFDVIILQSGFLAGGLHAAARFRSLVRLAQTSAWRLEAGNDREEVPALLKTVLSSSEVCLGRKA